jgi:protein TonB
MSIHAIIVAALATSVACPPTVPAQAQEATPRAQLSSYISLQDYPPSALQAHEQGEVQAALAIDPQGRVSACAILHSSGSGALDAATCRLFRSRARFNPAHDAAGAVTTGIDLARYEWRIPASGSGTGQAGDAVTR